VSKTHVYIGHWSLERQPAKGIAICEFDEGAGRIAYLKNVFEELCVGAAWPDEKRCVLYIADERTDLPGMRQGGGGGGQVAAFSVNPENGNLSEINRKPSYGGNPAFLVVDPDAKFLLAVNHGSRAVVTQTETDASGRISIKTLHDESSVVLFPLREGGFIGDPCDLFRLCGEGPKPFQLSAHAHSIQRSPSGKLYAVCDKGGDQIYMFRIDYAKKKIVQCAGSPICCKPGSAPRYSAFAPTLPFLFVNHEYKTFVSAVN